MIKYIYNCKPPGNIIIIIFSYYISLLYAYYIAAVESTDSSLTSINDLIVDGEYDADSIANKMFDSLLAAPKPKKATSCQELSTISSQKPPPPPPPRRPPPSLFTISNIHIQLH